LLGYFHFIFDYLVSGKRVAMGGAAACAALLANVHTYDVPVMLAVPLCFWVVEYGLRIREGRAAATGSSLPWGLAWVVLSMLPGIWHVWSLMQRDPAFGPAHVALGKVTMAGIATTYGGLLLAHARLLNPRRALFSDGETRWIRFLCVWSFAGLLVPFFPVAWARKALEGTHIPLSLLAAVALVRLLPDLAPLTKTWRVLAMLILIPSNVMGVVDACEYARVSRSDLTPEAPGGYLYRDEVVAFRWIAENTPADSVFLSSFATGSFLPAWTGRRVYLGHVSETHEVERKAQTMQRYFEGGMTNDEAKQFLRTEQIDFVFFGPRERQLARGRQPRLESVYREGNVEVLSETE
jgi:hypothetical protein